MLFLKVARALTRRCRTTYRVSNAGEMFLVGVIGVLLLGGCGEHQATSRPIQSTRVATSSSSGASQSVPLLSIAPLGQFVGGCGVHAPRYTLTLALDSASATEHVTVSTRGIPSVARDVQPGQTLSVKVPAVRRNVQQDVLPETGVIRWAITRGTEDRTVRAKIRLRLADLGRGCVLRDAQMNMSTVPNVPGHIP